jgi:hypothetical protein
MSSQQVPLKGIDGDSAVSFVRQQSGSDALNLPARMDSVDHGIDIY